MRTGWEASDSVNCAQLAPKETLVQNSLDEQYHQPCVHHAYVPFAKQIKNQHWKPALVYEVLCLESIPICTGLAGQ